MRHRFCSNMAKSRMNLKTLQYIMGYSDISVTLNTYTHVNLDDVEKGTEKSGRLLRMALCTRIVLHRFLHKLQRITWGNIRRYEKIPEISRVFRKRKTLENRAFEKKNKTYEEIRENDKNTVCMPRQQTNIFEKTLIYKGI